MPDHDEAARLRRFLTYTLSWYACDHTPRRLRHWCDQHEADDLLTWLHAQGARCACEAVAALDDYERRYYLSLAEAR